ncbi:DUF5676 family membrane protein [Pseudoduganella sp. OTU4001]|uniref:DUF5676 family membrane protein n=1 Tax=Pseudoduganella sp. OTU4001 TaxID=3043854 RepID=UPI00313ABD51
MKPVASGCALALTVLLFYSLCTVAALWWPDAFVAFVSDLFHGMDFARLMPGQGYNWRSYFSAAWVMGLWAFAMGFTFTWLARKFGGGGH